jgi:glycosyltransferase involved in cell wall biosynthesis
MVNGLAQHFDLSLFVRKFPNGREVNYPPASPIRIEYGPRSRLKFALSAAKRVFARDQTDFVLVQGYGLAALGCNLAARLSGNRAIAMLICSPIEAYYRCRRHAAQPTHPYRWNELAGLRLVARLNAILGRNYVVLSRYLEGVIRTHGGTKRIHRIPIYGIDTTLFAPLPGIDKAGLRKSRGLPESGSVIFFSSRTAPEKDVPTLLDAFRNLVNEGFDLWLLHRSGGHEEFKAAADRRGIGARVIATDAVYPGRELAADYQASDLCVQASREEGLGFSVLEALACGLPVIAAAVGGLKETVIPGDTGWTYVPGNAAQLEACIREALEDPDEACRRARAGRMLVQREYESSRLFEEFAAFAGTLMKSETRNRD